MANMKCGITRHFFLILSLSVNVFPTILKQWTQFTDMMVFMLCHMFSLMKYSHNALVGQLSDLFQPQHRQCFYAIYQKQKRKLGRIISQGVSAGLFPHNNGVQIAGRNVIKCQLSNIVRHFKFSSISHLCCTLLVQQRQSLVLEWH